MLNSMAYSGVAALIVISAGNAYAQTFPSKPIRLITAEAGGGVDLISRLIAQGAGANLNQQILVDNRGGAGGAIAGEAVARASADGYTLLLYGSAIWLAPFLRGNVPYDPVRDFSSITLAARAPNIIVIHPSLPARSVRELIALARTRPGELNYASASAGSSSHLAPELFKSLAGVNIVRIAYKGTGPALGDVLNGQVHMMIPNAASVAPQVKSGKLRGLAVTSPLPSALFPGLPTVAASGLPGFESGTIAGMFAPAKTASSVISRLNQEIVRALSQPDLKERLFTAGAEAVGSTPEQLSATVLSEMTRFGKIIRDAGIRDEF